jgi:hypothetical protein
MTWRYLHKSWEHYLVNKATGHDGIQLASEGPKSMRAHGEQDGKHIKEVIADVCGVGPTVYSDVEGLHIYFC